MKVRKGLTTEMVSMKAAGKSYREIGQQYGVSRQRVQQYFMPFIEQEKEVAERARGCCEKCGQFDQFGHYHHIKYEYDILNESSNLLYLCTSCHLHENKELHYCHNCSKELKTRKQKYCSYACRVAFNSVVVECSNCKKKFSLTKHSQSRIRGSTSGLLFCSKKCQGEYIGEHYGFKANPQNAGRQASPEKSKHYKYIPEIIKRLSEHESMYSILKSLGLPIGNYKRIYRLIEAYKNG